MMRLHQAKLMILIRGSKGGEIHRNSHFGSKSCSEAQSRQGAITKGFDDGYEITSRCIAFGSPVASCYAQSNNITSKQQNLIMMSLRP
jgi:hypothetical protein